MAKSKMSGKTKGGKGKDPDMAMDMAMTKKGGKGKKAKK